MQQQALMIMFIMSVIVPVAILFSNHNFFFVILSLILLVLSFHNIFSVFFKDHNFKVEEDESVTDEIEELLNIDMEKFNKGIRVSRNLVAIIFFLYCSFYVSEPFLDILAATLILYWVYKINENISMKNSFLFIKNKTFNNIIAIFAGISTIILIIFTAVEKFILL